MEPGDNFIKFLSPENHLIWRIIRWDVTVYTNVSGSKPCITKLHVKYFYKESDFVHWQDLFYKDTLFS